VTAQVTWWVLAALVLAGALSVLLTREMMRLILGLGLFLVGVAGLYAQLGFGLLAVAQLFVYIGGVLVLFLFAIMSMGRDDESRRLERPFDIGAASVAAGLAILLVFALRIAPPRPVPVPASVEATAGELLGALLPHFEAVGVLLLAALVAALAIVQGGEGE
jgi:NADH-quinone oxidoreductase subunit J